jgi:bifunctional DNA-binding transcriptional regulator/antitoxin component of YhaV-PrlF toxin-antitoxin module
MGMKTLLDDAGRIQLPDFVQAQLGVKPGDELALEEENGRWLIKLVGTSVTSPREPLSSHGASEEGRAPAQRSSASPPADTDDDDLNWEALDYDPVALKRARQVAVRIERRGKLQPMAHDLDEE